MSIEEFKNLSDTTITFNNKQEFENYYKLHQEEIDNTKTRGLNIKYKIPGYHIGRKQRKLILFPNTNAQSSANDSKEREADTTLNELSKLSLKIDSIYEMLNSILSQKINQQEEVNTQSYQPLRSKYNIKTPF